MINRKGEFRFDSLEPVYFEYPRNPDCWLCGSRGGAAHE